jgi:TRAP-type transport system small permease protein
MRQEERSGEDSAVETLSERRDLLVKVDKLLKMVGQGFNWIALVSLLAMFAVIAVDILSSKLMNRPLSGAVDTVCLLATIVTAFAVSQTILAGRHIEVEFIVICLPQKIRRFFNTFASFLSLLFFLLLTWRCLVYAHDLRILGEVSLTQRIPIAPFVYGIGIAYIPAVIIYALQTYRDVKEDR